MTTGDDVRIEVLGQIRVTDGDAVVSLSPQTRRVIGVLVTAAGEPDSADRIAEYVADGRVEGSTVRTAVSRARKVLGDRLSSGEGGYRLSLSEDELDAARFEALVGRSRSAPEEVRAGVLASALELWRGRAFGELADEEWAAPTAARLDLARATATEDLASTMLEAGRPADVVEILEPHVAEHPYRERPVGLLMRALDASGRRADAVRAYQRFRTTLRDDTGLDPSSELRDLEADLLADDPVPAPTRRGLPTGTVTFLFTDIEGSTERWAADEDAMAAALAAHDATLRGAVESHGGVVFKHTGDGMCAAFSSAPEAVAAAVLAQERLGLPVRMGLHTGEAELRDGDYFGPTLNRAARIMDAGHGGQVLMSGSTAALVSDVARIDLGEHRLKGLPSPERIVQVGTDGFAPLRAAGTVRGNLPVELSSFVGRQDDVAALSDRLLDHRLVTLIGVGGTGKTRLSIEAASALAPTFPDGCWMAQLAPVTVDQAVPFAVLAGLGIPAPAAGDPVDHLVRQLRQQRLLLVVDNCEHLLTSAADVIDRIVTECPTVTVLATSREPLMLNGEHLLPVASLQSDDAIRLFTDRATAEVPGCLDDETQRAAAVTICERLDGLPLAIELAASWVRAFTPVELLEMLHERFRVLVGGRRSRMERHQTMRGTLDWSYELCSELERRVFDRLAVFPARFDMASARVVAGGDDDPLDVTEALSSLVDRSLVQRSSGSDGTTRYGLLETMRAYGRDHLIAADELDDVREGHARHVATVMREFADTMLGPDEEARVARVIEMIPDVLAAVDWLSEAREWWLALSTCEPCLLASDRVAWELVGRVRVAAEGSGVPDEELALIRFADLTWRMQLDRNELSDVSWTYLRSGEQRAKEFWGMDCVPHDDAEVTELFTLIAERTDESILTRDNRRYFAIRSTWQAGLELPDGVWAEAEAEASQSRFLGWAMNEMLGQRAMTERRWEEALLHFVVALPPADTMISLGWLAGIVRWNITTAQAFSGQPVSLAYVVETWGILDRHDMTILHPRGCTATAVALAVNGRRGLAERFAKVHHRSRLGRPVGGLQPAPRRGRARARRALRAARVTGLADQ